MPAPGAYIAETTYRYVGEGAGEFDTASAPKRGGVGTACGLIALGVVLVSAVALVVYNVGVTTTTPGAVQQMAAAAAGPRGSCLVWGAPWLRAGGGSWGMS